MTPDTNSMYNEISPEPPARKKGVIATVQDGIAGFCREHEKPIKWILIFAALSAYVVYFLVALTYDFEGAKVLFIGTIVVICMCVYVLIRNSCGSAINRNVFKPTYRFISTRWPALKWFVYPVLILAILLFLVLYILKDMRQLQSLSGLVIFFTALYYTSHAPRQVNWRPVILGFGIQIAMGVLVLRTQIGYDVVKWTSDQIVAFIEYTYYGSGIVYGDPFQALHNYVFMGLSMLIYLGAVLSIMYYVGLTQMVVEKAAWFFQVTLGTTSVESLNAASNIFLNGMDTMMMFYPYLEKLTHSEFQCFLTSNHSTVAGFVFGLFVLMGAPPEHLLSAAVMSAPASLAVSKLSYPETETISKEERKRNLKIVENEASSIIEAGVNGATIAGKTTGTVICNFIGFLAILELIDSLLGWGGSKVGYGVLSYQEICSYLFAPLSAIMGVDWEDCREVGRLIGIKVFTSEILGFQELGRSIRAGNLSDRSATIATYALCGFCGLTTMSIAVGVWNTIVPKLTNRMQSHLSRAVFNANVSCFMTACIAGLMYDADIAAVGESGRVWLTYAIDFPIDYEYIKGLFS